MERTKLNLPDVVNHSPKIEYTKVPNTLINDPDISPVAFKVYCILISNPTGWKTHKKNLYDRMSCGTTSIDNALKELQDKKGLLVRVLVRDAKTKQRRGSFLAVTDTPFHFEFTKDRIHRSLFNKGFELYYKSYILGSYIIGSYIIGIDPYIKTIYKKEEKEKEVSLFEPEVSNGDSIENRNKLYLPLARYLGKIIQQDKNIKINLTKLKSWSNAMRIMEETDGIAISRMKTVLSWYKENIGGQFVPIVESGDSFRRKFLNLEAAIQRQKQPYNNKPKTGSNRKRSSVDLQYPE